MRTLYYSILFVAGLYILTEPVKGQTMQQFFKAVATHESGNNDNAVGDDGKSHGRYQIQYVYWKDSGVSGSYKQVRNKEYAEKVMLAYWAKYCPKALKNRDFQTLARVHNGGPAGYKMKATVKYWKAVKWNMR